MIKSSAPTRIDLAGGTLDIWPLYLLLGEPPTLNAAIDLYATVLIAPRNDGRIAIESKDLKTRCRFSSLRHLPEKHPLELILRTLKFYKPEGGLTLTTDCQAPQGSGIGGSSALNIALHGALNRWTGNRYSRPALLEIAKNIETQVIGVPAGWQDYFPALYGGVRAVRPGQAGVESRGLPFDLDQLSRRFVLCYTGKPRNSGINNWEVMKKAIDGDKKTLANLDKIRRVAEKMHSALDSGALGKLGGLLNEEWRARKALAPGISTPAMDAMVTAAKNQGALAGKVCGAGGGGCIAFWVREHKKDAVRQTLTALGGRVLPIRFVKRGLKVEPLPS
jgi:D-glycero-alpha-D-manno-heptose-7-phosphate kinase